LPEVEGQRDWDISGGLTSFVARTFGLPKDTAESRAMYLFSLADLIFAEEVGRSMNLNETQTITGIVWNQWFDLELGSTKFQRFFDSTLRDHYSSVKKILHQFGGHLTGEQAREFRSALSRAHLESNRKRFGKFVGNDE
jgi:hypothetical protein